MCRTLIILMLSLSCVSAQYDLAEGEKCDHDGIEAVCVRVEHCGSTNVIEIRNNFTICSFNATDPIICCPKNITRDEISKRCRPYTPRRPDMKIGKLAFHKCIDYQEQIKFPCIPTTTLPLAENSEAFHYQNRTDGCYDPPPLIAGSDGIDARRGQFPHMALLGYGQDLSKMEWLCGGTIISEQFILTAGHCTQHKTLGPVKFARLGILRRTDPSKVVRDYGIKKIIKHPEYKSPSKYNDIALLQTDKQIVFLYKHIMPACLDVADGDPKSEAEVASATGWVALKGGAAEVQQFKEIVRFTSEECSAEHRPTRLLKTGFDNATQICYGRRESHRDNCSSDSGGSLQVEYSAVKCMHKVIGVTSLGKACGRVYTRVRSYVPWIEAVVWPSDVYVFMT